MDTITEHYDYLVIGGGSGGYAAARTARETCEKVAIIDSAPQLGGLCILKGCMPSKTLLYSAEVLHLASKGATFGLTIPSAKINLSSLRKRKEAIIKEFADYRSEQLKSDRFTLFRETARFIDTDTIQLSNGTRITADKIMIATGSKVATPSIEGLQNSPFWTSDTILGLDFENIPQSVIVLGGGIVACELAQFLNRIGIKVTQIQRSPRLLKSWSPEASKTLEAAFTDAGIELYTDTQLQSIQYENNQFSVAFTHHGKSFTVNATNCLNALGRVPNSQNLGLIEAGIQTHASGHIVCDANQQTSNPRVYASGDVTGPHEIVHTAILQGELAAKHAFQRPCKPINYNHLVTVVFTDPQLAKVGLSEAQLIKKDIDYIAADYPFDDHGKSILMEALYGYVKVFASREGIILGAECVSKDAGELIHALAVAVTLGATAQQLLDVHWYHPTLSEIWTYPLEDIQEVIEA